MKMTLDDYRLLPYTKSHEPIKANGSLSWLARVDELPLCHASGETLAEAMLSLDSVFDEYITKALDKGEDVPLPNISDGLLEYIKSGPKNGTLKAHLEIHMAENLPTSVKKESKDQRPLRLMTATIEGR